MRAIAANASPGETPQRWAAAAASAALPTFTSPGMASSTSYDVPSGACTVRPSTVQVVGGRDSPQVGLVQPWLPARTSTSPQAGHDVESNVHRWPAPTQTMSVAALAAQTPS